MNRPPSLAIGALGCGVILLVMVGVSAVIGRGIFPADFATRADPVRQRVMGALDREDPLAMKRPEELDRFDRRFASDPSLTLLHILPGGLFLILAPLQFSSRVRNRHIGFHRWSGRVLIVISFASVFAGLYFGLLMPYGGPGEATAIALFGGLFLGFLSRAFLAIRRGQVTHHREWMIRAFSVAIGISTVRVVAAIFDVLLTPAGLAPPMLFALSLWTGWVITLGAGELWIRYTRRRGWPLLAPVNAA